MREHSTVTAFCSWGRGLKCPRWCTAEGRPLHHRARIFHALSWGQHSLPRRQHALPWDFLLAAKQHHEDQRFGWQAPVLHTAGQVNTTRPQRKARVKVGKERVRNGVRRVLARVCVCAAGGAAALQVVPPPPPLRARKFVGAGPAAHCCDAGGGVARHRSARDSVTLLCPRAAWQCHLRAVALPTRLPPGATSTTLTPTDLPRLVTFTHTPSTLAVTLQFSTRWPWWHTSSELRMLFHVPDAAGMASSSDLWTRETARTSDCKQAPISMRQTGTRRRARHATWAGAAQSWEMRRKWSKSSPSRN